MKRLAYAGGAVALLALLAVALWQFLPAQQGGEEVVMAPTVAPTVMAIETELPLLPRMNESGPIASGLGGGVADMETSALPMPAAEGLVASSIAHPSSVFSGTEFVLAATLPAAVNSAEVYLQSTDLVLTVEMAQALAAQMGFAGPLYTTPQPADADIRYPLVYLAFQDGVRLTIDPYGSISYEQIGQVERPYVAFASEADLAVAEGFVQERGLLPMPYEVAATPWGEIGFYPVINGQRLEQMLGSARVVDSQVVSLYLQWGMDWQPLGVYPLLSPDAAWEQLLAQINAPDNEIPYEIRPAGFGQDGPMGIAEPPVGIETVQYWQREYQPGEFVTVYLYPSVLVALDGSAPIVETWPLTLEADDATRYALAETPFQLTRFSGVINAKGDGIIVESFEILASEADPFQFAEGTVARVDEHMLLTSADGQTYLLPQAPAELADGAAVYVFGWETSEMDGDIPIFNWESIEARGDFAEIPISEEPLPVEPLPVDPGLFAPVYTQVTISEVSLGYRYVYIYDDVLVEGDMVVDVAPAGPPAFYIQPVWQFRGTTEHGDLVTFYVQAVAPEYLE